jgi:tRNA(Ile)-lysidine synthase
MNPTLKKVLAFTRAQKFFETDCRVVVAVSGGPDSMAMLDLLVEMMRKKSRLSARSEGSLNYLHVAHLNHLLRADESNKDADFVREVAIRLDLPITVKSVDVGAAAKASRKGIEDAARECRYRFLLEVAAENQCNCIAVGHTMTDQAETVLMRLIRGTGLRGLSGMRPSRPISLPNRDESSNESARQSLSDPQLMRPLLCLSREEVEEYCRDRKLDFRTDATNELPDYTRNRVRKEVLESMRALNPQIIGSLSRAADSIAADDELLNQLAVSLLVKAVRHSPQGPPDNSTTYSIEAFLNQHAGMQRRMIIEAIRPACSDSESLLTSVNIRAIEKLLKPNASGKHLTLAGGVEVWRDFGDLVVRKAETGNNSRYCEALNETSGEVRAGGFSFSLTRGIAGKMLESIRIEGLNNRLKLGSDWTLAALDNEALPMEMVIRPRREGERAKVLGARGTIKLKNLMIGHRIPSSRRTSWPLVTTIDGTYIWSPGLPPSQEFAARDEGHSLAILRASAI